MKLYKTARLCKNLQGSVRLCKTVTKTRDTSPLDPLLHGSHNIKSTAIYCLQQYLCLDGSNYNKDKTIVWTLWSVACELWVGCPNSRSHICIVIIRTLSEFNHQLQRLNHFLFFFFERGWLLGVPTLLHVTYVCWFR